VVVQKAPYKYKKTRADWRLYAVIRIGNDDEHYMKRRSNTESASDLCRVLQDSIAKRKSPVFL